jgi:hypothetical protein
MINLNKLQYAVNKLNEAREGLLVAVDESILNLNVIPVEINYNKDVRNVISLDGSFATFWKYPKFPIWIAVMRVAAVMRRYNWREKKYETILPFNDEFFDWVTVIDMVNGNQHVNEKMEIIENIEKFRDISSYLSKLMIRKEMEIALKVARENENCIIFYDGSLTSPPTPEQINFTKKAINTCEERGNVMVGISKDSSLTTINGKNKDEYLLGLYAARNGTKTAFYITPNPPIITDDDTGCGVRTCFARLHENAAKWFRIDYMITRQMSEKEIIETIACYSLVSSLPGTPFPPLTAHEYAKKIRDIRRPIILPELRKMLADIGLSVEEVESGMTGVNGKVGTYHGVLDKFTKVKREPGLPY